MHGVVSLLGNSLYEENYLSRNRFCQSKWSLQCARLSMLVLTQNCLQFLIRFWQFLSFMKRSISDAFRKPLFFLSISFSLTLFLTISHYLFLTHSVSFSFTLYLSIPLCIFLFHSVSFYFTLYLSPSLCIFHFVSLSFTLYLSLSLCIFLFHSVSLSISLLLFPE